MVMFYRQIYFICEDIISSPYGRSLNCTSFRTARQSKIAQGIAKKEENSMERKRRYLSGVGKAESNLHSYVGRPNYLISILVISASLRLTASKTSPFIIPTTSQSPTKT